MSQDDSTAPGTGPNSSAAERRSGLLGNVPLLVGLVLVIAVGLVRRVHPRRRRRRPGGRGLRVREGHPDHGPGHGGPGQGGRQGRQRRRALHRHPGHRRHRRRTSSRSLADPERRAARDLDPGQPDLEGPADRGRLDRHADRQGPRPDARRPGRRPRCEGARVVGVRPRRRQPRDGRPERRGCLRAGPAGAVRRDEADRRDRRRASRRRPSRSPRRTASAPWPAAPTRPTSPRSPRRAPSWCPPPSRPTSLPAAATTSSASWRRRPVCRCCSTR